ncbi:MAG: hypothetical protein OJF50_004747 [Nitrospira sp.]|nr:hypothetical protein [Nitrospira sp.]
MISISGRFDSIIDETVMSRCRRAGADPSFPISSRFQVVNTRPGRGYFRSVRLIADNDRGQVTYT